MEFIKNRKGEKISVVVEGENNKYGLAFVMHGLGGSKEEGQIRTFIKAFLNNGITVISFDTTNTFGESDGNYENATITNYYEDLEDVINWAKNQKFYKEPFYLAGHSLGGICTSLYAENNHEKIKALAPVSTVISGKMSIDIIAAETLDNWKKSGYNIKESESKQGLIKKLKWSHIEDRLKYDILTKVNTLTMPVLLIVGENDSTTPLIHQQILFDKLSGDKELHIIKGASHTFRTEHEFKEIYTIFDKWIKKTKLIN